MNGSPSVVGREERSGQHCGPELGAVRGIRRDDFPGGQLKWISIFFLFFSQQSEKRGRGTKTDLNKSVVILSPDSYEEVSRESDRRSYAGGHASFYNQPGTR